MGRELKKMKKIIIIGNAISAEILYKYIEIDNRYEVVAFAIEKEFILNDKLFGKDVIDINILINKYNPKEYSIIMAIGYHEMNQIREKLFDTVKKLGYMIETYIHPDANIFNNYDIGEGSIVLANSTVEPFAKIGQNSVIWANCVVGHHSIVADNCWIASGSVIAGSSIVGKNSFLGINTTIVDEVRIEEFNMIGAGAMISKNTKKNEVYLIGNASKHRFDALNYAKYFGI
jgi:sugar O-acyltransferase (sialic acid O-acetyltransferase NeuD family)